MKDVKFRAYCKETERMIPWDEIRKFKNLQKLLGLSHVDVMQYIGIKDIDGKDIYEGDIIQSDRGNIHYVKYDDDEARVTAVMIEDNPSEFGCHISKHWVEVFGKRVIGSIYENPELLKDRR